MYENTLEIPITFFIKERNSYYNWRRALFRELFTNSVDAESTEINVAFCKEGDLTKIIFADNGTGMSERTLREVYFKLGASSRDLGSVGGFGRARILTNFSMNNYEIHTQDLLVIGRGAGYTIKKNMTSIKGCTQILYIDDGIVYLKAALITYLRDINTDIKVSINGVPFEFTYDIGTYRKPFKIKDTEVGKIYFHEESVNDTQVRFGEVNIRVNGIHMFSSSFHRPGYMTIELDPQIARSLLTSNRDGFNELAMQAFADFIEECRGNKSALNNDTLREIKLYKGNGAAKASNGHIPISENPRYEVVPMFSEKMIERAVKLHVAEKQLEEEQKRNKEIDKVLGLVFGGNKEPEIPKDSFYTIKISEFLPDLLMDIYTSNLEMKKQIALYDPENWNIRLRGDRAEWGPWKKYYNLLMTWRICCELAIDMAIKSKIITREFYWSVGWAFRDDALANKQTQGSVQYLSLKPIDDKGKMMYDVHKTSDVRRLLAIARHEVIHIVCDSHDEDFASNLTLLDSCGGERRIYKAVRSFLTCK